MMMFLTVPIFRYQVQPLVTDEERAVMRGMEMLDRELPGWESRINLEDLDIRSIWNCVLGQLYGAYTNHPLSRNVRRGHYLGFTTHTNDFSFGQKRGEKLTKIWKREIQKRLHLHTN